MGRKGLVVAGIAAFALLGGGAFAASRYVSGTGCGYWRWPVKTGSDAERYRVNGAVVNTSIWFLTHLPPPSTFPQDARIAPVEDHIYQLNNVTLTQYKLEDDGDIHLIVRDAAGRSMITELPDPHCVSSWSLWRSRIATARRNFTLKFPVTTYWHYLHRRVEVQGLGFFDREHGQDGVAPNDIELHPVIWLWVAPAPAGSAPPPAPTYPRPPAASAW